MAPRRRLGLALAIILALVVVIGTGFLPAWVDAKMNSVVGDIEPDVGFAAAALHQDLTIVDLHNDFFLWNRRPQGRHRYGHTDLPRLTDGNVALQVFGAVIRVPRGQNYQRNRGDSDAMLPLVITQGWPWRSWRSDFERAMHQAHRVHRAGISLVKGTEHLAQLPGAERGPRRSTAGMLAIEGMHALEGEIANLDRLFEVGYRMFGLVHFFDNRLGGSAHGVGKGGLTPFGRQVVERIEARGGIVDLAHASPALIEDVLAVAQRPIVFSHTGVAGTCPGPRNLTDGQLRRVASAGGLIGVGFWREATCGSEVAAITKAIQHAVDVAGIEVVALGSDFDGSTTVPFDASDMVLLTQGLLNAGFNEAEVRAVMGENAMRFFARTLPRGGS